MKLSLSDFRGHQELRERIAELYDDNVTADNIIITNGTTGANSLAFQSLLKPGDHVIGMYPAYTPLLAIPKATTGVEVSYWSLDLQNQAKADIQSLKDLIKPNTKLIVLNNPNNPVGTILGQNTQREIVALAREHGIAILADEIFRPLFHGIEAPPSFAELGTKDDRIVVTGSMSKSWGLSGVRVGWIIARNETIHSKCLDMGLYSLMAVGTIDQAIATEALSDRCRPKIQSNHIDLARKNLDILDSFISQHSEFCRWTRPTAGATGFLQFLQNGEPVDDVEFCQKLLEKTGVLLAPGSLTFSLCGKNEFKGYTRIQVTAPTEVLEAGLKIIGKFLKGSF